MKKPTIYDVARLADVSEGTVSNVLNRPSYVSAELQQRVKQAMLDLDYKPRGSARQFRNGRSRNFGLVLADMANPFFTRIAFGAQEAARDLGVGLVLCNSAEDTRREAENLDLLLQQRVQGIILSQVDETSERVNSLRERGVPIVLVDRVPSASPLSAVSVNERMGGELVGEHLRSRGFSRVGFVGDTGASPKVGLRLSGIRAGFGGEADSIEQLSVSGWTFESGIQGAEQWLAIPEERRVRAVACANDMVALGLLQRLVRAGVKVPEQLAVIGYDDLEMAAMNTIPLTSVRQPAAQAGRAAVSLILREINRADEGYDNRHVVLSPSLVVRETG